MKKEKKLINILGDIADFQEVLYSMIISVCLSLVAYKFAPEKAPMPLLFGLLGLIIAFVINNFLFKPKRIIKYDEGDENDN